MTPTIEEIKQYLKDEVIFSPSILRATSYAGESKEKRVQRKLFQQLKDKYLPENVNTEYAIGGHWKMAIDVDLFNGTYGIELKVAEQLKSATTVERLLGQVVYYNRNRYHGNMIVMVVGKANEYDATMKELSEFIQELGVHFIYKAI